ncbi:isochorismatase family cysteine hydrolase [Salibacterium qingdaonense]|uniref:Nicotinamidase-related amidase n=1 Tax=Salibacterium qingdaonense TaxID=266892 RepID=A0A1I4L292_9BACI|nr:isochorismatase family cysteine hydrolase [Salibacterium qingdaonense]SFL85084.1 Nicotinamidase-related amidase [Salibacterium qingdaonense]
MNKQKTALVLIDLQKESNFGLIRMDDVIANTQTLINACRRENIPIIYTRQINRSDQAGLSKDEPLKEDGTPYYYASHTENIEIIDFIAPENSDIVIDKYRWSAFYETSLDLMLKGLGVEDLIIGGVVTDGCLMTSVFDAYFRDYHVHLVKDMCTSSNEGSHMAAMMIMANWVYNLEVYETTELIKRFKNESYQHWTCDRPDSLPFTPETMRESYQYLQPRKEVQ